MTVPNLARGYSYERTVLGKGGGGYTFTECRGEGGTGYFFSMESSGYGMGMTGLFSTVFSGYGSGMGQYFHRSDKSFSYRSLLLKGDF